MSVTHIYETKLPIKKTIICISLGLALASGGFYIGRFLTQTFYYGPWVTVLLGVAMIVSIIATDERISKEPMERLACAMLAIFFLLAVISSWHQLDKRAEQTSAKQYTSQQN